MKRLSILTFTLTLLSHTTFAAPTTANDAAPEPSSPEAKTAEALISHELIQPLAAKEAHHSRFTRAAMPQVRRVRILDPHPHRDANGDAFVRFAVDSNFESSSGPWRKDAITGCAYLDRRQVFVKKGDQYRPAAFMLGKNAKPAAETICQSADQVAHAN